jgi:hypothetical protein
LAEFLSFGARTQVGGRYLASVRLRQAIFPFPIFIASESHSRVRSRDFVDRIVLLAKRTIHEITRTGTNNKRRQKEE